MKKECIGCYFEFSSSPGCASCKKGSHYKPYPNITLEMAKDWKPIMKQIMKAIPCEQLKYSGKNPQVSVWCEKKKSEHHLDVCSKCWGKQHQPEKMKPKQTKRKMSLEKFL